MLWWVPEKHIPDWTEAVERHELLGDSGPSPDAFTFRQPFLPDGTKTKVDMDVMKQIASRNEMTGARSQ